jgi:hypothetical protein
VLVPLELAPPVLGVLEPLPMFGQLWWAGAVDPLDPGRGLAVDVADGLLDVDDEPPLEPDDGVLPDVAAMATPTPPASRPTVIAPPTTALRSRPPDLVGGI